MLSASHITVRYGDREAVSDLSFTVSEGQWVMLIGPNGAGKTTLLKAIGRGVPCTGECRWEGEDLRRMAAGQVARRIGVLAQHHVLSCDYTVEEIVSLGRYAYRGGLFSGGDPDGEARIGQALALTGMEPFRHTSVRHLSGGEMQRVFLAQVFAQDPRLLLLDEPANHLDLQYQQHIFGLIREWLRGPGRAVLSVVHDLSLARRFGTHGILMDHGRCAAQGEIGAVMTPETLSGVYGMDVYAWMRELAAPWQA